MLHFRFISPLHFKVLVGKTFSKHEILPAETEHSPILFIISKLGQSWGFAVGAKKRDFFHEKILEHS